MRLKANLVTGLHFRAINLRYHLWHRRDFTQATARVARQNSGDSGDRPAHWGICFGPAPLFGFDVTRPVDEQIAWLKTRSAAYLLTYPSNLIALLERSRETGFRPAGLRQVSTLGELLPDGVRELCRTVWDVPLVDAYSAQEVGMIALQCPDHPHYHVQSESLVVEIVDDTGAPCRAGETGRVIITDLHNFATPLVRYAVGDHATVGGPCPCGRGLPVIERVLGRTRNMLTLPDGGRIWPVLNPVFEDLTLPIRQLQLVQRTPAEIDVSLVVDRPLDRGRGGGPEDCPGAQPQPGIRLPSDLCRGYSARRDRQIRTGQIAGHLTVGRRDRCVSLFPSPRSRCKAASPDRIAGASARSPRRKKCNNRIPRSRDVSKPLQCD